MAFQKAGNHESVIPQHNANENTQTIQTILTIHKKHATGRLAILLLQ
jgi:hypothetical protein